MLVVISLIVASCYKLDDDIIYPPDVPRSKVHSERDFRQDTNLYALPGEVIVIHLEHLNTPPDSINPWNDTDGIGVDIIPFTIRDTSTISFRIDTTSYIIEMFDKETGQKVLMLNKDIPQRIRRYPPADYLIHLTSFLNYDDDTLNYQLIFIQPDVSTSKNSNSKESDDVFWFMQSRVRICKECDFQNGDFSDFDFTHAQLSNSNFNKTSLRGSIFSLADLSDSEMSYCDLNDTYLRGANLQFSDLTKASLVNANAIGANFCNTVRDGWNITGIIIDSTTLCLP